MEAPDSFINHHMLKLVDKNSRAFLMGISILWIIAFHYCYYSALLSNSALKFLFGRGYLGVDIFMFLSAYGLCHSYVRNGALKFYGRRAQRIFPMYLVFLLVVLTIYGSNYEDSPWLLFFYQITGLAVFRQVDVEWFIPALICLYVTFPLIFKGVKFIYGKAPLAIPVIVIGLSLAATPLSKVMLAGFPQRFGIIIVGVATYMALEDSNEKYLWLLYSSIAMAAVIFSFSEALTGSMLIPLILLGLSSIRIGHSPFFKQISFAGKHSLEIYLAQSLALNHYFLHDNGPFVTKCLISLAIIVIAAFVFYLLHDGTWKLVAQMRKSSQRNISH